MEGWVIKLLAGVYTVRSDKETVECTAKGTFRNAGVKPLVGDRVRVEDGLIADVLPRRNAFVRPAVANVDQLCIVLSPRQPKPDLLMLDKLIVYARDAGCRVLLCVNKCDAFPREAEEIQRQYAGSGVEVLCLSALQGEGVEALKARLHDRFTCFTGQSAVGKSSLMNALFPSLGLPTGGLSKKTDRGRHTTRHVEIFVHEDMRVADTPGFSLLECPDIEPERLRDLFDDAMIDLAGDCRFSGCLHDREPDCAVKAAVGEKFARARYDRYVMLLHEIQEKKRAQYD